jgi:hypothetical protein
MLEAADARQVTRPVVLPSDEDVAPVEVVVVEFLDLD